MKNLKFILAVLCVVFIFYAITYLAITVLNSDLYGRLTETITSSGAFSNGDPDHRPVVRLVLHKLLNDENAVEASLIIYTEDTQTIESIRQGKISFTATLRDGWLNNPFALKRYIILDKSTIIPEVGSYPLAAESDRFILPSSPSMNGYPFDNVEVKPMIGFYINDQPSLNYRFEIQKALPGRIMKLADKTQTIIALTRTPTEKALVIITSIIFVVITSLIVYNIFSTRMKLSTVEELLSFAGYLIATAGFRDILGLSREAGTSFLEIVVIGIPLLALSTGITVSYFRKNKPIA
jgi:hypothetical protein